MDRLPRLSDVGVVVLVPSWWTNRKRLGVRAKASTATGAVTASGFGFDDIVRSRWEAALGDERPDQGRPRRAQRAAAAKRSLVRVRGQWVEVAPPSALAALVRTAGARRGAPVGDLVRTGLGLPSIDAPGGARRRRHGDRPARRAARRRAAATGSRRSRRPTASSATLRPYQERGVGWLRFLGRLGLGACLADDMGLGKTAQLIAHDAAPIRADGPTLVVCPTSVLGNWERELAPLRARAARCSCTTARSAPHRDETFAKAVRRHDVVLTAYALLARDVEHGSASVDWGRLVLDEAQQVKNPHTAQARPCSSSRAGRRIALTGTPVENRLSELWSIMHVVNPGLLGRCARSRSGSRVPIERDGDDAAAARLQRV